jgi:hypothetical protein
MDKPKETPKCPHTELMTAHFKLHPENQVNDVKKVFNLFCPDVTKPFDRRRIVAAALKEQMEEVLKTL